ncbi:hypothetical protein N0S44_000481 [Escherichia coli]|nr:hypothetical protein [Escherichia coli]EJR1979321.1 hypothetical protein [Escherichia coli]
MKNVTQEKILYLAKYNGGFNIISREYRGNLAKLIDSLLEFDFIKWETNELWYEYAGQKWESDYDNATHTYTITKAGEVRLLIYRLAYAYKNHKDTDKHQRRIDELQQALQQYDLDINNFKDCCSKNELKAINDFNSKTTNVELTDSVDLELSPYNTNPTWGRTLTNINDIDFSQPALNNMFQMSSMLGAKGFDASRTDDYVLRKINEELGEMTLEMNIRDGLSYKEAGKDGVKGEAVDLCICALDMFALQCDNMSPEEMEREFLTYMNVKLAKWRKSIQ